MKPLRWFPLLLLLPLLWDRAAPAHSQAPAGEPTILLADEQFASGPLRDEPAVRAFLQAQGSFLASATLEPVKGIPMPAVQSLVFLGEAYSVSPALLLTLADMEMGVLSAGQPTRAPQTFADWFRQRAMILSRWFYDAYYGIAGAPNRPSPGGERVPPAGNAATYALRNYFFTHVYGGGEPVAALAAWEELLQRRYAATFGPPLGGKARLAPPTPADWQKLPALRLPWPGGEVWHLTGGPHNFDGSKRLPLSGVDFQPAESTGCNPPIAAEDWVVASAPGLTIDYQTHWVKLDHDGDGEAATGWQTVYGHLAYRIPDGAWVREGWRLGSPSCLGGYAGGVHVHFGVKYENVWQPVEAVRLSGWAFERGEEAYEGGMVREGGVTRQSCYHSEQPLMDCTHAAVVSDNRARIRRTGFGLE